MAFILSSNMNLPIPVVGQEPGPDYAFDINSSLTLIDQHDHSPGSGVQITPAGLNINADLDFHSAVALNLSGVNLVAQSTAPANSTIYESGTDLYFVDGVGNNVRITQSGGVVGAPGNITGLTSPASASYNAGSKTFVFQSGVNLAANLDGASLLLRNISPNSTFALTLQPPAGLSSNYSLTLPLIPASYNFLTIDTSGNIAEMAGYPDVGSNGTRLTASSGSTHGILWSSDEEILNLGIACSVASNNLTVALKTASGADASPANPVVIPFRSSTSTTGTAGPLLATAALSVVIPSTATLGHASGKDQYIYVYAINNAGTIELGVSGLNVIDELSLQSSTTISVSALVGNVLYATTGVANTPIRILARLLVNETVAGTWATAPTEVSLQPSSVIKPSQLAPILSGTDLNTVSFSSTSTSPVSVGSFSTPSAPPVGRIVMIRALPLANGTPPSTMTISTNGTNNFNGAIAQIRRDSDNTIITQVQWGKNSPEGPVDIACPISTLNCMDISDGSSSYTLQIYNMLSNTVTVSVTQLKLTASVV